MSSGRKWCSSRQPRRCALGNEVSKGVRELASRLTPDKVTALVEIALKCGFPVIVKNWVGDQKESGERVRVTYSRPC